MNQVGQRLAKDHQEIEGLLESLARATEASDRESLLSLWSELEGRLVEHMNAEERFLLPLIEASHPAQVKRTLLEHARIRDLICELGLAVELHSVRRTDIQGLIDVLRLHSEFEDSELYARAGDKASAAVEHRVLSALKAVARSALETARVKPPGSSQDSGRVGGA